MQASITGGRIEYNLFIMYRQNYFKKTKYNNVKQTYEGYSYDSKFEARVAAELDLLLRSGEIVGWERQFKIELYAGGKHICNYFCDFRVEYPDKTFELLEAKGIETEAYRLKRKLMEAVYLPEHLDHTYRVVKEKSYYLVK